MAEVINQRPDPIGLQMLRQLKTKNKLRVSNIVRFQIFVYRGPVLKLLFLPCQEMIHRNRFYFLYLSLLMRYKILFGYVA